MAVDVGTIDVGNTVPVSAASLPLPTGASTEATLALIKAKTDNLDVALSTRTKPADTQTISGNVGVTGSVEVTNDVGNAIPISAVSLPLPTGASTEATLSGLNGKFNSLGQKTMANSAPFVIASDQTSIPTSVGLPTFLNSAFGFAVGINQPTSGTDNPLVLLKNPNASGKTVYISFIAYGISVANVLGTIRIYKNPTITANGTAQTITAFGTGSTVATLFTTPTISANGTLLSTWAHGQNSNSLLIPTNYEITVPANSNLLITGSPGSNNRQAEMSIRWVEI